MNTTPARSFRLWLTAGLTVLSAGLSGAVSHAEDAPVVLENSHVLLEIDPAVGTFSRILDKGSGIELAAAPGLAENFRLALKMPGGESAIVRGKDQKLAKVRRFDNGLALRWDGPLKDTAGTDHKIAVRMDVRAIDEELQFQLHLDNHAACTVLQTKYPMIGGLKNFGPLGRPPDGVIWLPTASGSTVKIETPFDSAGYSYPGRRLRMSFTCVQSETAGQSLYFAAHDRIARYKTYLFHQLTQGDVKDVFVCVRHFPSTPPGETFDGSPVVLRMVDGDWHAAGRVYRAWYEKAFGICKPSQCWIRRQSFLLDTMFLSPEGTINLKFKDIPQWAKEAKDYGINAVLISGWDRGGHDNGYPHYTIDPRLGTWKELEDGIKACHDLGVKVYFFVNYQQVVVDSELYRNELHKYREHTADGGSTWNGSKDWGQGTVWSRMGHATRLTGVSTAFPQYRKLLLDHFVRLAEIGADGLHVDKMFPRAIDYNPNLPVSPDASYETAVTLTKEIFAACRKYNPDWAMSFETHFDVILQFGGATWWTSAPIIREVFPEHVGTRAVFSAFDYLGVNKAVREGQAVLVGPLNCSRPLGWKPWEGLAEYIKEVKRIQDSLLDTVFLGEVLGHKGVHLSGDPAPGVDHNVFRNVSTGKRVCIFTNAKMTAQMQTIRGFESSRSDKVRIHVPFQDAKVVKVPAEIEIPAERIVFIEEMGEAR